MVDRVDLLIAVIGIVVSVVGSSTALWMAVSKKADRDDVTRLEARIDSVETKLGARIDAVETKLGARIDSLEARLTNSAARVENKLDALILRFVPETPRPEN